MIGLGTEGGKASRRHIMNSRGCRWPASEKGAGSRVRGIQSYTNASRSKTDGYGGLVVFRNCRNLVRTLAAIVYSRSNPEDVDDSCEQHATDALRYGLTRKAALVCGDEGVRDLSADPSDGTADWTTC